MFSHKIHKTWILLEAGKEEGLTEEEEGAVLPEMVACCLAGMVAVTFA